MKKRILSILLALVMLVGMFPVQAFASERSYVYVSFEVCDADGSGRTLIKPERNERVQYTNDYALAAMRQAIGSNSDVKYDSDHLCITGVKDASQSDGFLDNGDIKGYRWIVLRNNAEWDGTDYNTMYKLGDNEVLRCIYTNKSVDEMSAVNKDAFIRYLSEVGENMWYESSAGYAEYMAALNVLVNSAATNADVQNATNALVAALTVSATVVEINQGEEMELGVHKSATLKATVTPSNTTDTMVWSSVDDSIVSVNATTGEITGVAEGETNVTVTVGAVSDTIKIIVKPIAATAVSIKNGEAISLEARASVQLEADVTPAGTTDTVSWSVADQRVATVDENGLLTGKTVGQTTVTATAGNVSDTITVTVTETTVPYVYFEYADGRVQELENDTFTLTALDEGSFKVGNFSSKLTWKCSDSITNSDNETEWRYWINTEGKYQPHGIKKIAATVTGNGFSKTFYINEVSSGISEVKVSVNGTEVDAQNPYSVTGMTTGVISVQGLKDGQWIYIPTQAWMAESGNTNIARILGNQMEIIDEGQSDVTVTMVDNEEAAASFSVVCGQVPVTGIEVHAPASFVIEKWDSMDGGYVGIIFGYEKPASEYYITFTPSNATNRNVIWTNLTPEIAEFHELHGAGIVPKKAGTAKFRVTSESNPDVYQDVEIVFSFKTPLTNAVIAEKSYALEEGQTVDLDITVTPDNATEPRFIWTYSKEGIVKVTETVSADTYTRTVTRRLNCLRTGSVTVTGTPIDDSANCPPIQFTVVVGDASGEDTTDYLQIAKNDIAHGKAYLSGQNQTYFNNEWTIFTYLRTGGTMDAQKKIAYLQNVQDEIANYGDSLETLDYTRLILTLPLLGENPANFADKYDLVEALCNSFSDNQTSNMYAYGLLTLDSMAYEMPADSAWSRDALIEKILTFQASDGSFGLGNNSSGSVDMTAIVLQALAPYNNANHPAVQTAITKALSYLKENLSANAGFEAEGGENACSSAQVLIALTALGIDPSDKDSGFTIGKSNLITNLDGFKLESGGFYWLEGNETVNLMGTQQITYAMEAYRRFVLDLNPLYDLTDLNESGSSTFTVTLPEGEGFDAKICDGFASTVAKGGDFSFYIVIESGYERSNMVVKAGNTILTADSYGVYTIKNIKADVQVTVTGVEKLDYTKLLSATVGQDPLDAAYIGVKNYKTGNGTQYQNIPFYTVKLPVESALTLTYNSTNPRAMLWMNYDNRFKENSGTYTFSSELLAGMYAMSSEKFVEAFGSDTGLNTTHTVAFIEVTTMGYNRLCCVLVELVPAESEEPEIPLAITVNGEAVEVTSIGDRTYSNAFGWGPYTLPFFTVKVPANTDFTITAEGAFNFACYDGYSLDGSPFTVSVDSIQNIGGSGVGFGMSAEKFVELFGSDTGLNTENKLAFIEINDDNYDGMYGLLVELEGSVEPEDPENPEDPDITIPITAELLDGTALTVTVNGTQSVNGNDVPVLEIAIPEGTSYVKVIPSGSYQVYDCDGWFDENADNLSVVPSWGDFYTLTADGGRTIDYVIKFVEAKEEEKPEATLPITAELHDGTALTVTVNGTQSVNGNDVPVLEIAIPEGTSYVKVIPSGSYQVYDCDGWFDENADNLSVVPSWGDFYTLTADGGRTIDYVIKFVEAKEEEKPEATLPITAELLDGTALTVSVNGTQSVNGNDVPVLEIAIPVGTAYVKVIPGGNYRVYDDVGSWEENADELSVIPMFGDFYTLTADGGRTIDYVIKFVEAKEDAPVVTVPIDVSVNGEVVEVTSIGDRTYSNAFGWGPYTLPFFTVKVPADTEFTITAEGAVNFACYDGYSLDGSSPFTVPVDSIQNIGGSGVGFGMSAEKFVELFGSDTGLNTENKLAFIEIKDDNYDRMYGLLVELEGSVEPEDPENPEDPDITIPITAELLDGTALTVTVNGTQSVNGIDVPVLEIAIPVGTTHVKVIPGGNYRVFDDVGSWEENADELSVIPMFGDFYTLTADGGRTIDYVIKFAEAKEEPPVVTVPITVTVNGEAVEVTSLGEREYLSSSWKDPYTKPIYTVKIQEGADFVINQTGAGDGASGNSRAFAMADGQSFDGNYPYTMTASCLNNYYLLSAEEFVERVGNNTGLDITQKLAFIEVQDSFYERIYVLLVELIPAEPEPVKYQVNLTEGAGFTLRAAAGSASPVEPGSSFSFTISINESFEKTTDFAVKANGVKLEEVDGKYTISNIQDDQTVTVEGVVGKATTDTLTVTANGERCNVVNTGLTSYKQSIYGTITDVPVYKTSVPADTDFIVNWHLDKDGDDYSSTYRYAFSIDAGGDQGAKYYPFTMRTSVFGDYMLSAAQVKEFFGLDISSANALFMEVYGSEHSEGDFNPLYGLLVELVVPKTTYTVNFALLGDHKHADGEAEVHTLIDNNLEVWVAAKDYEVVPGATILDLLSMVAEENNLIVGNPNGDYVKYITKDGVRLSEFTNGARSGWMYTINGNHSGLGVAEQKLADGDVIVFHYTDDYTREKSSPADLEAAAAVVAKINAIGTVSLESKAKIEEARAAYDALSEEQRDLIGADVLKKLTDAEETYVELEKNAADKAAAEAVEDKISAIGTVTMDSKAAIDEARAAYEELSDTQKNLVSNYQLLSQAEAAYAELVKTAADEAAAKVVDDKINAIGTVTLDSEKKIVEAREAYDALTDVQKALVTNREKLLAAEKKLVELKDQDAADAVEAKIATIGTVTLNSEAKIKAAREAYNALTDTQKALVENLAILEAAEEALELLNLAGTDITNIYKTTGDYLAGLSAPVVGSTNGEWRVIGLTRAGKTVADSYYDAVVEYVKNNIDANGRLDESKSTENARVILALTAISKDVTNVGGYNLLKGLDDMSYIRKQGINGLLWTLIAFDSHDYEIPAGDVTREKLVQAILDAQVAGGGWALNGNVGDPDMTGMALQALSPYYGKNTAVTAAVDKALTWLSGIQNKNGSFSGNEGTTSESLAQVITGLTALGINPETDSRFIKNGVSTVDALSKFYVDGGGFKHDLTSGQNMMATEQAYYALVSYYRLLQGKTSLFDMSDVTIVVPAYKIIEGTNSDWQKDDAALTIRADGEFAKFTGVKVDGKLVDSKHYTAKAGSTVITFTTDYLKTLSEGEHTITVTFADGEASTSVSILPTDEVAAKRVMDAIDAIGTVTEDSGDKIKAARKAYDALTAEQKKLVTNYKILTDAESAYDLLISKISVTFTLLGCYKHDSDVVHTLSGGNLSTWIAKKTYMVAPGATVKDVLQMALTAAGMNYKNPTGNYVESINGIGEFTNGSNSGWMYTLNGVHSSLGIAEQTVKEGDVIVFHYTDDYTKEKGGTATDEDTAIENVEALINAIGTVTLNSKSKIDAARKAYDVLSFTQKQKVENYKKLTDAETKYAQLKADDDEKKANTVEDLIDAIISGSSTFEKDVKAAQKAYNNLTADQKKLVDNYYKLANYLKDLADEEDKEAAKTVEALIDAIGAVTKDSEDEIKSARAAYDKLTDTQKALVNNYAELEDAEARWEDLQALVDVENIYKDTGAYLKRLGTPVPGSVGGEWMAIGLIRSGNEIKDPAAYYDAIVKFIQENIDENGRLHMAKSTENSRIILALTALGKDATAVGGYNLLAGLNDMEYVQKQGINGPIWALIALDSGNYPAPEGDVSREALIQVILDAQLVDGGWALTGSISDADITGMALQALAHYYKTNADVTEAVDKAIAALSMMQAADGSFASVDGGSSESVAQVIAALSALGIDADTDTRFIKNGVSALDALCAFFVEDGGFKHIHDGKLDGMATEQSYYALVAYFRMLEGKTALFDMTDVVDMGGDQAEEEPVETQPVPTEPAESPVEEARSFPWWLVIVIGVLAGAIVVVVIISKPKKGNYVR